VTSSSSSPLSGSSRPRGSSLVCSWGAGWVRGTNGEPLPSTLRRHLGPGRLAASIHAKTEATPLTEALAALEALTFDESLAELERTVAELEAGGLPLEQTIARYERGVALEQRCEQLLADAELRVRRLVEGARGALAVAELRLDGEAGETPADAVPGAAE
jgi:exodeoxyribonuclease VII small subunit